MEVLVSEQKDTHASAETASDVMVVGALECNFALIVQSVLCHQWSGQEPGYLVVVERMKVFGTEVNVTHSV